MNEQRYKEEHLRHYWGILTSEVESGSFKMELKVEDNLVLQERLMKKIKSSEELEFEYDIDQSTKFFHDMHLCKIKTEDCPKCQEVIETYNKFELNIRKLQVGDTFGINAAFISNYVSVLPQEIGDLKKYKSLIVACKKGYVDSLRLPDTIEGINKK